MREMQSEHPSPFTSFSSSSASSEVQLHQRIFAAGIAACVSALVTNPLDVIKTRMQTSSTTTPHAAVDCPPKCPTNKFGATNCVSTQCAMYDGNAFTVGRKILRREGVGALWKGTRTALIMAGPAVGVYLPCYDFIRDYCVSKKIVRNEDTAPLLAGAGARTLAVLFVAPLELLRTRQLANEINHNESGFRHQHFRAMFTGVSSTLARDVPFSMMYWYSVEKLRTKLSGQLSSTNPKVDNLASAFMSGNLAGVTVSALTTPGDVLKTRIQVRNDSQKAQLQPTLTRELKHLIKHEGMSSLFTGVIPRALRGGPTCAIVLVSYELVKSM